MKLGPAFPRLIDRGLIEAKPGAAHPWHSDRFPRLIDRGLIEALALRAQVLVGHLRFPD